MPTEDQPIIIRGQVRSRSYRAAFSASCGAYGFLIGDWQDQTIDFALPVAALNEPDGFYDAPRSIDARRAAAERVAKFARRTVCGAFVAFDHTGRDDANQIIGLFIDCLRQRHLAYLLEFSMLAWESMWGITVFRAMRFPHDPLPYRMARRQSVAPHHNPRRIHSLWAASQRLTAA